MSSFTTPLMLEYLDGTIWRLSKPFIYYSDLCGEEKREWIRVPMGFITDFASIPQILWIIERPTGLHGKAAVLHDWLYQNGLYTRKVCDMIFREAMEVSGVEPWRREAMYYAVRTFSSKYYKKKLDSTEIV